MESGTKKLILGGSIIGFVLCLGIVGFVAACVGSEVSKLDRHLSNEIGQHPSGQQVQQELTAYGTNNQLSGTGPHHQALIYSVWVTLNVTLDADGKMIGYAIDRAGKWF
jgi:hypothetical protein